MLGLFVNCKPIICFSIVALSINLVRPLSSWAQSDPVLRQAQPVPTQSNSTADGRRRVDNTARDAGKFYNPSQPPALAPQAGVPPVVVAPPAADHIVAPGDITGGVMTSGMDRSIFVGTDNVLVKPPLLKSLISINRELSPLTLDAASQRRINLGSVVESALRNNLDIKISTADQDKYKWNYIGALGGFLPDLVNDFTYQTFGGAYAGAAGAVLPINSPALQINPAFNWTVFKGGQIIYTALQNKHLYRASSAALKGTISDVLLKSAQLYYELVLNDVLLQIRVKAVETSAELVRVNDDLFANGVVTKLDVLRSQTQLSRDRQALIQQQVVRRQSAINLATALNWNTDIDLQIADREVQKVRLVDEQALANVLLATAIENRPELKRYDELRIAAADAVKVARGTLAPEVSFSGAYVASGARVSNSSRSSQNVPLPTSDGVSVGSSAGGGTAGLPLGSTGMGGKKFGMRSLYVLGLDVNWTLGGLTVPEVAKIQASRADARRVQVEFARQVGQVYEQVRNSYLSGLAAENLIVETTSEVQSSEEALRIATERLTNGVDTELDVVQAQRDYTSALINKAKAIIQFNTAQAQLLHDIGRISMPTLVTNRPLKIASK